ncbi:hypothetical protein BCY88_15260 [Paraburkholderia fungorum]|uniref:Uncharacterized protein n=2 Tax=Paraburkholderia fungorum TaxID=134537 RepID=A0A3R7HS62_9BURK|nr:hypothetical protein BCY88_15260 [Paraburkholderia fungorum]
MDLRKRVIGSTWHSQMMKSAFLEKPRFYQTLECIAHAHPRPARWLAIDDDDTGWANTNRDVLVQTGEKTGLGSPAVVSELQEKLELLRHPPP